MSYELWTQQPGSLAYPGQDLPPRRQDQQWRPPMALWQLALLIVFTGGLYIIVWAMRFVSDLERHVDPSVRPWLHAVGVIIPLINLVVLYVHYKRVRALNRSAGQEPLVGTVPFWAYVLLVPIGVKIALAYLTLDVSEFADFLSMFAGNVLS